MDVKFTETLSKLASVSDDRTIRIWVIPRDWSSLRYYCCHDDTDHLSTVLMILCSLPLPLDINRYHQTKSCMATQPVSGQWLGFLTLCSV